MKASRLAAAISAALIALLASRADGQATNNVISYPFPASLGIGSLSNAWNTVVTSNACAAAFQVAYTSSTNTNLVRRFGTVGVWGTRFSSYQDFQHYLITNGMYLYSILKTQTDIGSTIQFIGTIELQFADGSTFTIYSVSTNIGPIGSIASNTFAAIQPDWTRIAIQVPGLIGTNIQVATAPPYSWPGTSQYIPPQSEQPVESGWLMLNQWYCTGAYPALITLTNAVGQAQSYRENGLKVQPASLKMVLSHGALTLTVDMSQSGSTAIQSSTDMVNWSAFTNYPWPPPAQAVIPINRNLPRMFFRVQSND